jgi:hypothetical protein
MSPEAEPTMSRLRGDDRGGLRPLEVLGIALILVSLLAFFPTLRGWLADAYNAVFKAVDPTTGEPTDFSIAARGILITVVSILSFIGAGFLLLYTNLGTRLAFLVTGAATFGWMVIGSLLFVIYAPRGLRPANLEGLNSFQIRIPAIAVTLASFVLFVMFVVALDRYERDEATA